MADRNLQLPPLTPGHIAILFFILGVAVDVQRLILIVVLVGFSYLLLNGCRRELRILDMEVTAKDLLVALKSSGVSVDGKVTHLTKLKSEIKQKNIPENAVSTIFDALHHAISSQHSSLSAAGFSALGHLLKRLYLQEQYQPIANNGRNLYPLLLERLGDHKERIRAQAAHAFTDFWPAASAEVEHLVLEVALVGKNARAKEVSMIWLLTMTKEYGLLFRAYVSSLVGCLEDADSGVRDTAKMTVVELFQNGPSRAKSDLKKQLQVQNVRKSIVTSILANIGLNDAPEQEQSSSLQSQPKPDTLRPGSSFSSYRPHEPSRPNSVISIRSHANNEAPSTNATGSAPIQVARKEPNNNTAPVPTLTSQKETSNNASGPPAVVSRKEPGSKSSSGSATTLIDPPPQESVTIHSSGSTNIEPAPVTASTLESPDGEKIDPRYVNSRGELDEIIREMVPHFEGKECEGNWGAREKSVLTLRRLTRGNAPLDYSNTYVGGIKTLLDGILKTVNSLRTTLSATGCYLVQDIARTCGPGIDHMVEIILQNLIKLCGGMKKISAQNGNITVDVVIANVSYTSRILQHMLNASQDKNVQPRLYATGWLKTLINKQSRHKSSVEHGGGLEMMEKTIKRGLADSQTFVREAARGTYWTFAGIWPESAENIISTLDPKARGFLEQHPSNPNIDLAAPKQTASVRPKASSSNLKGKPTLKETIAAQKKARLAAKNQPARPESAQATFSEVKSTRPGPSRPAPANPKVRTVPTGAPLSSQTNTLSSAPMRPPIRPRRPELMRPATADPYSSRKPAPGGTRPKISSPANSPQKARAKLAGTPGAKLSSPARPKSRLDVAKPATSTNKPKRLDISTLKSNENRFVKSTPTATPSEPKDVNGGALNSTKADDPIAPVVPRVTAIEGSEFASTHEARALPEDIEFPSEKKVDALPHDPPPGQLKDVPETPIDRSRFSSDGSKKTLSTESSLYPNSRSTSEEQPLSDPSSQGDSRRTSDDTVLRRADRADRNSLPYRDGYSTIDTLRVYEDPEPPATAFRNPRPQEFDGWERTPRPRTKKTALEELPLNGPIPGDYRDYGSPPYMSDVSPLHDIAPPTIENSRRKWSKIALTEKRRSISPRSKDPTRARDMIEKGLCKIRAKAIDVHGYRKLQGLILYHDAIFKDEGKYDEMLLALVDELESTVEVRRDSSVRPLDMKTQILVTLRLMFDHNGMYFAAYYPRVMTALITARKQYESSNYIVSGLEELADDIIRVCNPPDVMDAILDLLETEEKDPAGYRAIRMGVFAMTGLLRRFNRRNLTLPASDIERLGRYAHKSIRDENSNLRRCVIQFCVQLRELVEPEDAFWAMINTPYEDFRPLLTYYLTRKPAKV